MPLVAATAARTGVKALSGPGPRRAARALGLGALHALSWLWFVWASALAGPPPPGDERAAGRASLAMTSLVAIGFLQGALLMPGRWSGLVGQVVGAATVVLAAFLLGVHLRASSDRPWAATLVGLWAGAAATAWLALGPLAAEPGAFEWTLVAATGALAIGLPAALALRLRAASRPPR